MIRGCLHTMSLSSAAVLPDCSARCSPHKAGGVFSSSSTTTAWARRSPSPEEDGATSPTCALRPATTFRPTLNSAAPPWPASRRRISCNASRATGSAGMRKSWDNFSATPVRGKSSACCPKAAHGPAPRCAAASASKRRTKQTASVCGRRPASSNAGHSSSPPAACLLPSLERAISATVSRSNSDSGSPASARVWCL